MALTRKMLKGMGLSDEQIDTIIEAHTETVDSLKDQVAAYKEDADKLPGVQKSLEKAQADLEAATKDSYKVKYDALKEDFDAYKADVEKKDTHNAKEAAYRELLKAAGVSEKRIAAVLKVSDIDSVELDDSGNIKDADALTASIKTEWADFIPTTQTQGANTPNPPSNTGGSMTKEDIMNIKDRDERIQQIAQHKDLFTKGGQ